MDDSEGNAGTGWIWYVASTADSDSDSAGLHDRPDLSGVMPLAYTARIHD